jgi:heme-degrading monooxygenase HmoA
VTELLISPPPAEAIQAMAAIPGVRITPSVLATQTGAEGDVGPEEAGAVLMLQATFATAEGASAFWTAAVPLMRMLAEAPGFLRRYSFGDGPAATLIAFWRTVDDAKAFAARPEHRAATRGLYSEQWQHSHFSAIWELVSSHGRVVFCGSCGAANRAPVAACRSCDEPLTV